MEILDCDDDNLNDCDVDCYEEYEYEYEDEDEIDVVKTSYCRAGLHIEGILSDYLTSASNASVYKVYQKLSEFCIVNVDPKLFTSALLIMKDSKENDVFVSIEFSKVEPLFPFSPPIIQVHSLFKYPHDTYTVLFNCNPLLMSHKW